MIVVVRAASSSFVVNLEAKGVVDQVIETQKRSFNDRSGSVSNEIAIGWFHDFNNLECFSARGSPQCVNVFGSMSRS